MKCDFEKDMIQFMETMIKFNNHNDMIKYKDLPSVTSSWKVLLLSLSCIEGVAMEANFNVSIALATSIKIK